MLAAFDVLTADLAALLRRLDEKVTAIHAAGAATVTVGVGASLFDDRFGLRTLRPRFLTEMPAFPNDVLDPTSCGGDLLLQICAASTDQAAAVLSDLAPPRSPVSPPSPSSPSSPSSLPVLPAASLRLRWRIDGFRAENRTTAAGLPSTRNLFGFREGAGNPDPTDASLMDTLIWTGDGEPAWAAGGTYQVVRLIRLATQLWNRDPISRQEEIFGRHRTDGTPLTGGPEDTPLDYTTDPDGHMIPLDAHIRRANPRTPETTAHRILRRSYSYRRPDEDGLIFICFQRDPESGFATIQRRLSGEPLDHYILPFGGGYFFIPPSITALTR